MSTQPETPRPRSAAPIRRIVVRLLLGVLVAASTALLSWYARQASVTGGPPVTTAPLRQMTADAEDTPAAPPRPPWRTDTPALRRPIDLTLDGVPVSQALALLAKRAKLNIACVVGPEEPRVSVWAHHVSVGRAMEVLADLSGGQWQQSQDVYVLHPPAGRAVADLTPRPTRARMRPMSEAD